MYFWYHSLPVNSDEWYFLIQQTLPGLDLQSPAMKRKRIILIECLVGFYHILFKEDNQPMFYPSCLKLRLFAVFANLTIPVFLCLICLKTWLTFCKNVWLSLWRIRLQCGRPGFDPWVGEIPWRRERLPIPVLLTGEFHGQNSRIAMVHKLAKNWTQLKRLSLHTCT